ncbi:MAG TPA: TonB-dependent siderophore receptor [Steroidobacteraceae bacterium]|nr:TonB-dependent siderophore receptor [Steroidobacteraceae bacterium]
MSRATSCSCLRRSSILSLAIASVLFGGSSQAYADDTGTGALEPVVTVIGDRIRLDSIPGSAAVLDAEVIQEARVFTVNEALRKVPGIFARDEEGFGLRPNLGIRGLNPTRSSKVLMLEDGIPLSYAPYGDNASYYHPPVERFERIEVLKGSGQVLFGPHTVGGVINYITPAIPDEATGRVLASLGTEGFRELHGQYGDTFGDTGIVAHGTFKQSDGARENMNFEVGDLNLKVVHDISDRQALTLRASWYDESSQVTYSGLTLAEWRDDPYQNPFRNDHMYAERWGASATHRFDLTDAVTFTTNAYYTDFNRDWWRQSSNSAQRPNDASDPACGGMSNLYETCGNEGRLRQYWTAGLEPRVVVEHGLFGLDNVLEGGLRYHYEDQFRVQANGDGPRSRKAGIGTNAGIREDSDRTVEAMSAFVQNQFDFGRWTVTPGVRFESVDYERTDNLTGATGESGIDEVIPGFGATFEAAPGTVLFAGVHRGFAPPGVADIVTAAGGSVDLDAELSWNYELGLRATVGDGFSYEATLFRMDFENQIVPASVAGGSGATLTSAGETLQQGVELAAALDSSAYVDWPVQWFARGAYTWLADAEYAGDRYSNIPGFTTVRVTGNRLPYTPEHLLSATVGARLAFGLELALEGVYTSAAYTDDLNTVAIVENGQRGEMPGYTVWNLTANYTLEACECKVFAAAKNLTDKLYVTDMSRGLIPGMPRIVQAGFEFNF